MGLHRGLQVDSIDVTTKIDVGTDIAVDTVSEHTANAGVTIEGITLKDGQVDENLIVKGDILPEAPDTRSLGSATAEIANIYLGTGKIYLGTGQEANLYLSGANLKTDDILEVAGLQSGGGIEVTSAVVQAFKYEKTITSQLGAWVHGVKIEVTRGADIQPSTGAWFGGQFVLNAGSAGYTALDKPAYVLQAIFKGSDTNPNGIDIHVGRFELQSSGKVSDIVHILANTGTTIIGSMLYLATHIDTPKGILVNVQSSKTLTEGLEFQAGAGSTITSCIVTKGAGTITNLIELTEGKGGSASGSLADQAGYITVKIGGATKYIPLYDTLG